MRHKFLSAFHKNVIDQSILDLASRRISKSYWISPHHKKVSAFRINTFECAKKRIKGIGRNRINEKCCYATYFLGYQDNNRPGKHGKSAHDRIELFSTRPANLLGANTKDGVHVVVAHVCSVGSLVFWSYGVREWIREELCAYQ